MHWTENPAISVRFRGVPLRLVFRFLVRAAGFSELLVKLNQSRLKTAMCIAMDIATMAPSNNWFSSPAFQVGNSGSSPDGATTYDYSNTN